MIIKTLSEITDVNNKLIRTFFHLAISPRNVINDKDNHFTSPIKYLITVTGGLWILIAILSNEVADSSKGTDWTVSTRYSDFIDTFNNINDEFSFVILGFALIPSLWLITKLIFFRQGTWGYFLRLGIYLTAQLSSFIAFIFLITIIPMVERWINDSFASFAIGFFFIGYFFFFLYNQKFHSWYWTLPKSIFILIACLYTQVLLKPYLIRIPVSVLYNTKIVYPISEDMIPTETTSIISNEFFNALDEDDDQIFFTDNYGVGKIENNESMYFTYQKNLQRMLLIPESNLVFIAYDSTEAPTHLELIKIYDYNGTLVFSQTLEHDLQSKYFELVNSDENHFELLVPKENPSKNDTLWNTKLVFDKVGGIWSNKMTNIQVFDSYIYKFQKIEEEISVGLKGYKPGNHWSNISIAKFDSGQHVVWETELYDKSDIFDLKRLPSFSIVEERNEIIAEYSIPNDTATTIHLFCLDLENGNLKWETQRVISVDDIKFNKSEFLTDEKYIYIIGNANMAIRKNFWTADCEQIFIGKFALNNGDFVSQKFIGTTGMEDMTSTSNYNLVNSDIHLLVEYIYTDFLSLGYNMELLKWVISTDDL
jgi:hypothetical protein